jgi:hypothetical protein
MREIHSMHTDNRPPASSDAISESAKVLLRRVFRVLRGCGIKMDTLREMTNDALLAVENVPNSHANRVTARQALMCCDVVLKWRRDPRFLDANGLPASLSLNGQCPSFAELVEVSAPGEDWQRLMESMIELGVVRSTEDTKTELISDSVVACSGQDGSTVASECVLEHICGFLGSVEYNVFDKPSREKGRFERACYASVPKEIVPVLEKMISSRGQDFVDVIDEWLARRAVRPSAESGSVLVGAGAYVFVRRNVE